MKKTLLIIFLVFLPNLLFALDYVNEFPTYVYGDIRPIAAIYNSIAMITNSDIYETLISLAVLFSVVSISWSIIVSQSLPEALKSGSFTMGMVAVMLTPVDVHLVDKRLDKGLISNYYHDNSLGYEKISNVPWLIALSPSIATTISADLITLVDDAFAGNTVNYSGMKDIGKTSFSNLGYNKAIDITNKIVDNFTFDEIGTVAGSNLKKDLIIYLNDCVIPKSTNNSLVTSKLISPSKDIYSEIAPSEIGIDTTDEVTKRDGTIDNCVNFYNIQIVSNLKSLKSDLYSKISKIAGVNDITQITGIENIMLADIQSTVFTQTSEQLAVYASNVASAPVIKSAIESYYRGTNVSGQDLANSITAAKSTANLQVQGLGQFKWMAEMLPYAMHFFFGIILAASIITLLMMLGKGVSNGTALAKNYFGGFIQFESIRVSLSLVNNLVMYYSSINAADKLSQFGGNPLASTRLPGYLEYIATMEGVSGVLAVSAIFIIPAIALKGDVASVASAMQGLSGKYAGNDLENARDVVSKSSSRQRTIGNIKNDEDAMKKLNSMGLSLPPDRSALEYYNAVTNDLANMGQGFGNMLSQDKMNNFSKGSAAQQVGKVSQTAGYGSSVNMSSAGNVAYQDGQVQGHQTNATESYRNKSGWNANKVGTGNAVASVGKDLSSMAMADNASSDKDFEEYAKGSYNQGAITTAKTKGAGSVNLSNEDLENIGKTVRASIESEIGKGAGVQKNYDKYGDDAYKTASEYGERSSLAKTMEKIKAQGGVDSAVGLDALDSSIKASQQKGSIEGTAKEYNEQAKKSGKTFNKKIEDVANDLARGKAASDIATVDYANDNGGYVNYQRASATVKTAESMGATKAKLDEAGLTKSEANKFGKGVEDKLASAIDKLSNIAETKAGAQTRSDIHTIARAGGDNGYRGVVARDSAAKMGALISTMNEADGMGGYENYLNRSAREKTGTAIKTLDGKEFAGMINSSGSLTSVGAEGIYQAAVNSASETITRGEELNNQTKMNNLASSAAQKAYKLSYSQDGDIGNAVKKAKAVLKELSSQMSNDISFDENGNINNGQFKAKTGADMAGVIGSGAGRRYTDKLEGTNIAGISFSLKDGQVSAKQDNSTTSTDVSKAETGSVSKVNLTDAGNLNAARSKEQAALLSSPKELFTATVGKTHQAISDYMQKNMGMSEEEANAFATSAGAVAGSVTAVATAEGLQRAYNYAMGNRVATNDFSYQTGTRINKDGIEEPIMKDVKKGQEVNVNKDPHLKEYYSKNKGSFRTEGGFPSKFADKMIGKGDKDFSFGEVSEKTSSQTSDSTKDISTDTQQDHSQNEIKNKSKHSDTPSNDLSNYNTNKDGIPQNYNEKSLNQQKIDLANKNPDNLARETLSNQAQMKVSENLDNFRSGNIDATEFGKRNADLSSFMSKVDSGADVSMRDLNNVGIKPTGDLPIQTKMSKNNKAYEVIDTNSYGQQLKEVEAQKIRVAQENLNNFDTNGNPKVSPSNIEVPSTNIKPNVSSNVDLPNLQNIMTETQARTVGALPDTPKAPMTDNWFMKRVNGVQDAISGPGNFKTKLGLAASALLLGSQSETFANTLNAIDPMQMVVGQELGKGSDIVPMNSSYKPNYVNVEGFKNLDLSNFSGGANNFAEILRDGQVKSEFANMAREQNPNSALEQLQMQEIYQNVANLQENLKLEDINISNEQANNLKDELQKMKRRVSKR